MDPAVGNVPQVLVVWFVLVWHQQQEKTLHKLYKRGGGGEGRGKEGGEREGGRGEGRREGREGRRGEKGGEIIIYPT